MGREAAVADDDRQAVEGGVAAEPRREPVDRRVDLADFEGGAVARLLQQGRHQLGLVESGPFAVEQRAERPLEAAVLRQGLDVVVDVFVDQVGVVA